MYAYATGAFAPEIGSRSLSRAETFILENRFERPTLVMDTYAVARQYGAASALACLVLPLGSHPPP